MSAQANEFLIQVRDGKVLRAGQGLSCFKWPSDTVAIVPTSIAKLSFAADQVTVEKVGVEVRGLAVYRIADPLLAYRMMDLDRTSLTSILNDMFVGATRRIVARLTIDECLTHRKDRVAQALMSEIAPILAGEGSPLDVNPAGWGVVLDTIEIQDVRVLSQEVFERLQAPYREKLALQALLEEEARIAQERRRADEVRAHEDRLAAARLEAELARKRRLAESEEEAKQRALEARRREGELETELAQLARKAHEDLSDARLREVLLTETVPQIAQALRGSFDHITITPTTAADLALAVGTGLRALGGTK